MIPGMITGGTTYILSTLIASGILEYRFFLILITFIALLMITELYRQTGKAI